MGATMAIASSAWGTGPRRIGASHHTSAAITSGGRTNASRRWPTTLIDRRLRLLQASTSSASTAKTTSSPKVPGTRPRSSTASVSAP